MPARQKHVVGLMRFFLRFFLSVLKLVFFQNSMSSSFFFFLVSGMPDPCYWSPEKKLVIL